MKELDANKFFYIFELMFETKNIQLVDEALRSIHVSPMFTPGPYCLEIYESIQRSNPGVESPSDSAKGSQ